METAIGTGLYARPEHWGLWEGPDNESLGLVELANLRSGFRWASRREDVRTAVAISAHAALLGLPQECFEPVTWAEEILPLAIGMARPAPRLLTAASLCTFTGRPDAGAEYARAAVGLGVDAGYDPLPKGLSRYCEGLAHLHAGRFERAMDIYTELADQGGAQVSTVSVGRPRCSRCRGAVQRLWSSLARDSLQPGTSPTPSSWRRPSTRPASPRRRPTLPRRWTPFTRGWCTPDHRQRLIEASIARDAARVEASHGDIGVALPCTNGRWSCSTSGNLANLAFTLASLAVTFERLQRSAAAAILYGSIAHITASSRGLATISARRSRTATRPLRGDGGGHGAADAVAYSRAQIRLVRTELAGSTAGSNADQSGMGRSVVISE